MSTFQIEFQKKHLHFLQQKLRQIESCDCLMENDPEYYSQQQEKYMQEYAVLLSQLAQGVFKPAATAQIAVLIGDIAVY